MISSRTGGAAVVLGRFDADGRLRPGGRTTPLKPDAARQLAEHLTAAGPDHPWTGVRLSSAWGARDPLEVTLVEPDCRRDPPQLGRPVRCGSAGG